MKIRTYENNITVNGVRQGFTLRDSISLKRGEDHSPRIQIFKDQEEEKDPEKQTFWCAVCKSQLIYLEHSETIWRCDTCMAWYDTNIQDTPLKSIKDMELVPRSSQWHYATFSEDDPSLPFVQPIDLNKGEVEEVELVKTTPDKRIQTIRVKGLPDDAIRVTALSQNKD